MRYGKSLLWVVPLLALGACGDDDGITSLGPPPPAASVRFINANVDTGTVDLSFIDGVENLPTLKGVAPRGTSGFFQRVGSGARQTRVFPNATDINLTSIELVATSLDLRADQRYTMVYAGRPRLASGDQAARLAVIEEPARDALPNPGADQIALRVLHTGYTTAGAFDIGNVDVYVVAVDTTNAPTPGNFHEPGVYAHRFQNVSYLNPGGEYATVPARPRTPRIPLYRFVVTAPGSTTALFAVTPNQPGTPAPAPGAVGHGTVGGLPGVQVGGSVMTVLVAPGTTPGSRQSTAGTQVPTVLLLADKVLNP